MIIALNTFSVSFKCNLLFRFDLFVCLFVRFQKNLLVYFVAQSSAPINQLNRQSKLFNLQICCGLSGVLKKIKQIMVTKTKLTNKMPIFQWSVFFRYLHFSFESTTTNQSSSIWRYITKSNWYQNWIKIESNQHDEIHRADVSITWTDQQETTDWM